MNCLRIGAMCLLALAVAGGFAKAQPLHLQPGSALIYPMFDSRPGFATVMSVTNTNEDRNACTNGGLDGDVLLHYTYYGQPEDGGVCLEFDRFELLTPADTLSVLADHHNPEREIGFLVVTANDPESGALIQFDYLIGSAYVANARLDIMWCYTPYAFTAPATNTAANDVCGRPFIRDADFTSPLCFDGLDYLTFPTQLYIDSFFEEDAGVFDNVLSLMSTSGQDFVNEIDFYIYNNKEDRFSRTFKFVCHTAVALSEISGIARNLGGDPSEFLKETGWARMKGRNVLDLAGNAASLPKDDTPAILGVLVQIVNNRFTSGSALHYGRSAPGIATQLPIQ